MKRYASIRLVAAAALLIASGGCKDDDPGTGLNGPAVLAIQNAGAEPLQISLLEPKTQTIDIRAVARSVSAENLTVTRWSTPTTRPTTRRTNSYRPRPTNFRRRR
mgnify:CR=1 FL=1